MQRVDVDGVGTTFTSSSATLALPAGSTVLFAGLYYGARVTAGAGGTAAPNATNTGRATVLMRAPGAAGYATLGPAATVLDNSTVVAGSYGAFVNVTAQVAAAGSGVYTVANVQAGSGNDRYAGWSLVVAYENGAEPLRNLSVFDGLQTVAVGSPGVTIPFSGFATPPVGPVRTSAGFVAYEGDRGSRGDSVSVNGRLLQDASNPSDNFFNSAISQFGVPFTAKTPNYENQLGFDAIVTGADGYLPNGANGATLRLTTNGEQYLPQAVTLATELFSPQVQAVKSVEDVTRPDGPAQPGDVLRYTVTYTNNGSDAANAFVATDEIPDGTRLVPGSISASGGATAALEAGAVVARLASLAPDASLVLTFDVLVGTEAAGATQVVNVARAAFTAATGGQVLTAESDPAVMPLSQDADLSVTKVAAPRDVVAGQDVTYTIVVRNNGPSDATGAVVSDVLPAGVDVFSVQESQGSCSRAGGTLTCSLGTLAADATAQIVVAATVPRSLAGSSLENAVSVTSAKPDPDPSDNSDSLRSPVGDPEPSRPTDLSVSETSEFGTIAAGAVQEITITVRNRGSRTATGVVLTKTLSSAAHVVSAGAGPVRCATRVATVCRLGRLGAGESVQVRLRVRALRVGTLTDTASVASDNVDRRRGNNVDALTMRVAEPTRVSVRKVALRRTVAAGRTVRFRIVVTAAGELPVRNARVCDVMPGRLSVASASGARVRGQRACWTIRSLAVGSSRRFAVTARAGVFPSRRRVTNVASVRGGNVLGAAARARVVVRGRGQNACAAARSAC